VLADKQQRFDLLPARPYTTMFGEPRSGLLTVDVIDSE
jgi:hypothetical protein